MHRILRHNLTDKVPYDSEIQGNRPSKYKLTAADFSLLAAHHKFILAAHHKFIPENHRNTLLELKQVHDTVFPDIMNFYRNFYRPLLGISQKQDKEVQKAVTALLQH